MTALEGCLVVSAVAGVLVLAGLAVAVRMALAKPTMLEGSATVVAEPDCCLLLELRPRRRLSVTELLVSREIVAGLGLEAPAGFAEAPLRPPDLKSFEPDLEPLLDENPRPSDAELEAESQRQLDVELEAARRINRERVRYAGRLRVRRRRGASVRLPAERAAATAGNVIVGYQYRIGFWGVTESLLLPLSSGD